MEEELEDKEAKLKSKIVDIALRLEHIYIVIRGLNQLATTSHRPYTKDQHIFLALRLIKNIEAMEKSRGNWSDKLKSNKTWINLEKYFNKEWMRLQNLCGQTMKNTGYQQ